MKIVSIVFTKSEKADKEAHKLIRIIRKKEFDSFMITAVTGFEEKREDAEGYFGTYKVYHLETSIFVIENNTLFSAWDMCLDIYDYQLVELTISDYVSAIIRQMEYENVLLKKDEIRQGTIIN